MSDAITIHQGDWEELGDTAGPIRHQVFVVEQKVPEEEEWDGRDAISLHFVAYRDGVAVGAARLLPDAHIGRVAVLAEARGQGVGQHLVAAAVEAARTQGHPSVELSAQLHALPFYEQLGFEAYGDDFLDAGIPHRNMRLSLVD